MARAALKIVTCEEPKAHPKYLHELPKGAQLTEIYVYSKRDYAAGAQVAEQECYKEAGIEEPRPFWGDRSLIDLGGAFTKGQVDLALKKREPNEDPAITKLRETIVDGIELKKLFYSAVRTHEEAHKKGIVFEDPYLASKPLPLGVMAFES